MPFLLSFAASTSGISSTTSEVFTNTDTSTLEITESTNILTEIPSQATTFSTNPDTTTIGITDSTSVMSETSFSLFYLYL